MKGILGFIVTLLFVLIIFLIVIFTINEEVLFDCEEYEQVPYRYSGGFFNTQVKTVEGNHDGYWNQCIKGTSLIKKLFPNNGEKRNG